MHLLPDLVIFYQYEIHYLNLIKFGKKLALQNLSLLSKLLGGEEEKELIFPTIQLLATDNLLSAA